MYYFVADVHLGGGTPQDAKLTEQRFVRWLDCVSADAQGIFICGDLFDFWFEYKRVAPKGFVRTLGRLAQLTDRGVRVVLMAGNHDQWVRDYLQQECGIEVYTSPRCFDIAGEVVYLAHGDNINIKRDPLLKLMNSGFRSKWLRTLFSTLIHPDLALKFGQWWSRSSRAKHTKNNHKGQDLCVETLVEHASNIHATHGAKYYIFGHVHTLVERQIEGGAKVIIVDDWSQNPHYAEMDKEGNITIKEVTT